jgi:hypothetical protein
MDTNRDGGPDRAVVHTSQWCTVGWDAVLALVGLAVLMLGLPLAIVVVLGCWVTLSLRARRARPGWLS